MKSPTIAEIKVIEEEYKYECKFCVRRYKTKWGLHNHMVICDKQHGLTDETFVIKGINTSFDTLVPRGVVLDIQVKTVGNPNDKGCEGVIKEFWSGCNLNPSVDFIPDPDDV